MTNGSVDRWSGWLGERGGAIPARRLPLLALGLLVLAMFAVQACDDDGSYAAENKPAPDFNLALLDGDGLRLSDLRGQAVILNFFASWCIPCRAEAAALQSVFLAQAERKVMIVGVALKDTKAKAIDFVEERGVSFPVGLDASGEIGKTFRVFGLPTTFFIDGEGIIRYTHVGAVTEELAKDELDKMH